MIATIMKVVVIDINYTAAIYIALKLYFAVNVD